MSKLIKQEKAFWKRYFNWSLEDIPTHIQHINLRCTEVNDEGIAYITNRIKHIEQLDLDETEISNIATKHLIKLNYLQALRLKDNYKINNDCIEYLNKLQHLQLLHLGHTSVTIQGVLQLNALPHLKYLYFSSTTNEAISNHIEQLHHLMPGCTIVINGKEW